MTATPASLADKDQDDFNAEGMGHCVAGMAAFITGAISFVSLSHCITEHIDAGGASATISLGYAIGQIGLITGTGVLASYIAGVKLGQKSFRELDPAQHIKADKIIDPGKKYETVAPVSAYLKAVGFGLAAAALVAVVKTGYDRKKEAVEEAVEKTAFVPPSFDLRTTYVLS